MLPVAISLVIWFLYPPKIRSTLAALVNQPFGMEDPYSLAGLLFYPNVVLHFFGSVWQSILPITGFILAFKYWKNPGVRFVLLLGIIQLALAIPHHTRGDRHMVAMAPALALAAGFVFGEYWSAWSGLVGRWAPRAATIAICGMNVVLFPSFLHPGMTGSQSEVPNRIAAEAKVHKSTLILGTREFNYPSPPGLDWSLVVDAKLMPITHSGVTMNVEEDRKIWRIAQNLPLPFLLKNALNRVTSRGDQKAKLRSIYLGLVDEGTGAGNVEEVRRIVSSMDAADPFEVIYVATNPSSRPDYPIEFIDEVIRPLGFERVSTETFAQDARGDLYRRTAAAPDSPR